jgi:hypothetical protein
MHLLPDLPIRRLRRTSRSGWDWTVRAALGMQPGGTQAQREQKTGTGKRNPNHSSPESATRVAFGTFAERMQNSRSARDTLPGKQFLGKTKGCLALGMGDC